MNYILNNYQKKIKEKRRVNDIFNIILNIFV